MKVNVGKRCSGKTTKMLIKASQNICSIVITPSFNRIEVLERIAKENNIRNIRITTFDKFLESRGEYGGYHLNIYIDDLDDCLNKLLFRSGKSNFEIKEVNFSNENENENENDKNLFIKYYKIINKFLSSIIKGVNNK